MLKWIYFDFVTMSQCSNGYILILPQCHNVQMDIFWFCNNVAMFKWIYFDFVTMSQCRNVQMDIFWFCHNVAMFKWIYFLSLSYWSSLNGEYIPRLPMRRHHNPPPSMEIDGNWGKLRKLGGVQLWLASWTLHQICETKNCIRFSPNRPNLWKCKNWQGWLPTGYW